MDEVQYWQRLVAKHPTRDDVVNAQRAYINKSSQALALYDKIRKMQDKLAKMNDDVELLRTIYLALDANKFEAEAPEDRG